VVCAMEVARALGMVTVGFTGAGGGKLTALTDHLFAVDSRATERIQEAHILAGHMLCDWIERDFVEVAADAALTGMTGGTR
jgi:D-sedoheptulose 7-phosphate isomerase